MMGVTLYKRKEENSDLMAMDKGIKLPDGIKQLAEELAKYYGMPINQLVKEIRMEHRRQMVKQARERIIHGVEGMDKLYKEDKELTMVTKSLECEDFHEY